MTRPTCGTCRFFEPNECHYGPPTPAAVFLEPEPAAEKPHPPHLPAHIAIPGVGRVVQQEPRKPMKIAGFAGSFPPTTAMNWCGKHEPATAPPRADA